MINVEKVAELYTEIMKELKIQKTPDNAETPLRVAKSLEEMTRTLRTPLEELNKKCTIFENNSAGVELTQDDIEFASMCSHHHLPFVGKVRITYKPNHYIIGLSKFKRVVDYFAGKPQVQEDMTGEILDYLAFHLDPLYLKVEIYDCLHTCMCSRGVKSMSKTTTKMEYSKKG